MVSLLTVIMNTCFSTVYPLYYLSVELEWPVVRIVRLTVTTVVTSVSERRVSRRRGGRTSALTDRLGD